MGFEREGRVRKKERQMIPMGMGMGMGMASKQPSIVLSIEKCYRVR